MRIKDRSAQEILESLLDRSTCHVQVSALLMDRKNRVVSYGWNSAGPTGMGLHAEIHCLQRANPKRVADSILYVMARRRKSGNPVTAHPCAACAPAVRECEACSYRDKDGLWKGYHPI